MSSLTLVELPECVLLDIIKLCSAKDIASLSLSCTAFWKLCSDDLLWKNLCQRELRQDVIELGEVTSHRKLYSNLLHKYKSIIGVYQTVGYPHGNLLEVKYDAGTIKGIHMEGTVEVGKLYQDVAESVLFVIRGNIESPEFICLPEMDPHDFTIDVDQDTGALTHRCSDFQRHMDALYSRANSLSSLGEEEDSPYNRRIIQCDRLEPLMELMVKMGSGIEGLERILRERKKECSYSLRESGPRRSRNKEAPLVSVPLLLPDPHDVPAALRNDDGSIPKQIITPGLFRGDYSTHGVELILFKYVSDNELHGFKVTGDTNVFSGKISVKIFLDYPVNPPLVEEQRSIEALASIPKVKRKGKLSDLQVQRFVVPEEARDGEPCDVAVPRYCLSRFHGALHIADDNYQNPTFIPSHAMVFNNDLIGEVAFELDFVSFFTRVKRSFQQPLNEDFESVF